MINYLCIRVMYKLVNIYQSNIQINKSIVVYVQYKFDLEAGMDNRMYFQTDLIGLTTIDWLTPSQGSVQTSRKKQDLWQSKMTPSFFSPSLLLIYIHMEFNPISTSYFIQQYQKYQQSTTSYSFIHHYSMYWVIEGETFFPII